MATKVFPVQLALEWVSLFMTLHYKQLGKIVATGGQALLRFNTDGSLDSTFSEDAIQTTEFWISTVAIQNDGKILVTGRWHDPLTGDDFFYLVVIIQMEVPTILLLLKEVWVELRSHSIRRKDSGGRMVEYYTF